MAAILDRPRVCGCTWEDSETYSWAEGFKFQVIVPSAEWVVGNVVEIDTTTLHKITNVCPMCVP